MPVDDGRAAVLAFESKEDVAVYVVSRKGRKWLVVKDRDVGRCTRRQNAKGLALRLCREILLCDGAVVLEEHVHGLGPTDIRQAGIVALYRNECLQGLKHVVGICVSSHSNKNASLEELEHRSAADGVVHVRLGVVDDHRLRLRNDVHVCGGYVDAVAEQGLLAQQTMVEQPVDCRAPVILQAVIDVVHAFAHMDMKARQAVVRLDHLVERLVRQGKECMATEHGRDHV